MVRSRYAVAAVLLQLSAIVLAHGHDEDAGVGMGNMNMGAVQSNVTDNVDHYDKPAYAGLSSHSASMAAHIGLMVAAWFFVLPIGVMFSISRSRFALPIQFLFLAINAIGLLFGTIYNVNTPDLYENNRHHKFGWIATWIMTAQVVMSLLFFYSGRNKQKSPTSVGSAAFLGVSVQEMVEHNIQPYSDYRWSGDSGQGTERSSIQHSRDISPNDPSTPRHPFAKPEPEDDSEDDEGLPMLPERGFWRNNYVDRFLSKRIPGIFSARLLKATEIIYEVIDRTVLFLSFFALASGGVVYAGIFRGDNIFNGMAHFVKGGIFFWYGLLTLGRWMGCFADFGWAWNIKPTRSEVGQWKASVPSAEFVESFVIWLYGCTTVFMEHMAAWGSEWSAQDLEHVSISIMFFGGGLCGMLVESKKVRDLLNTSIEVLPARSDVHPSEAVELRQPPKTYSYSLNPMPGLIILLLGVMMSSHHQDSMVSTMVHKQWGTLLVGFSLARGVTYLITYISPPTSVFAARPPSELISAFCLISGGLIFMASTKDIIHYMEVNNIMAMFIFTVMMGFTAFLMAFEIIVLSLKGWVMRKEISPVSNLAKY